MSLDGRGTVLLDEYVYLPDTLEPSVHALPAPLHLGAKRPRSYDVILFRAHGVIVGQHDSVSVAVIGRDTRASLVTWSVVLREYRFHRTPSPAACAALGYLIAGLCRLSPIRAITLSFNLGKVEV